MTTSSEARIIGLGEVGTPDVDESAWVAPGAVVVGNVTLRAHSSVWYNAVIRSDYPKPIELGEGSNLQDNVSCHVDAEFPLTIGRGVSVGHGAVLHGCTIGDDVLIGMGATILNGVIVGSGSLIAAGTVLLEGTVVPAGSLVAGVPGKVRRELRDEEIAAVTQNAETYLKLTRIHSMRTCRSRSDTAPGRPGRVDRESRSVTAPNYHCS